MSYRVNYGSTGQAKRERGEGTPENSQIPTLTLGILLAFLLLVSGLWPQGRALLQKVFWPGDSVTTAAALEGFALELQAGVPLEDAVEGFCREILQEAGFG